MHLTGCRVLSFLLFIAISANSQLAAQTTGSIIGRVVDAQSGLPLVSADIRVQRLPHRTTTGADGRFVLGAVPPGERDIRIEQLGYKPMIITRLAVRAGAATEVRVALDASPVDVAPVIVRADRQRLIEPEVSATHEVVVGREIRELPVDRIEEVLELTTGVSGGHFRGGRIGQEVYVIDGIELKNQFEASRQGFGLELSPSSLEEVDVLTGGFGAEFGSALSGVVSYTTRRGNPELWESRVSVTTDHWAPASIFRGFTGLSLSSGGPLSFLGSGTTLFADVLLQGMLDADVRARGLTCLTEEDAGDDLAAAIRALRSDPGTAPLYCPFSSGMIPNQRGDKLIAFARLDKPLSANWNTTFSVLRNRAQRELYTSEFKYNPTHQLGQRLTGTLVNLSAERLHQAPSGSSSFTMRSAVMRLDRYLGALDPNTFDGFEIAGFRPAGFKFIGEEFARRDVIEQIQLGSAIPGYIAPSGGANSPFGTAGVGIFFTEGTPTIANWSRSDVFSGDLAYARFLPSGSTLRTGAAGKLYRVETYERTNAHMTGSLPNYARFYPATIATYGEVDWQTDDNMHFQFGVRLEAFRSGIDFQADRVDFLSPVIESSWKLNVMPRVGAAFPIPGTQGRSGIRFNFGRVAQPPDFRYFLDSTIGDSLRTDIRRQGNPNLAFEKGNSYEVGVSQLFGEHLSVNATAFRKTLENVVSGNLQLGELGSTGRFSAGDFGTVRGVEVTARARWTGFSMRAGWALQKATGVSSGLENDTIQGGDNPAKTEFPLAFDRRHSADFALFLGRGAGSDAPWSVALTGSVQSGYPLGEGRLPWTHTADLRASWDFARALACDRCRWRVVFDGRNVLGSKNILALRSETGALAPTLQRIQQLANAAPAITAAIPRESPAYVPLLDANRDGVITPQEANAARFAAALDRFDPTLFIGEGRQIRLGVEIAF
jgi:hypothetical protein